MTIYVDDFYKLEASVNRSVRLSHMFATTNVELEKFARTLGLMPTWKCEGVYRVSMQNRKRAVLMGAIEVTFQELAAMKALHHMGYDMEPVETARQRRSDYARQVWDADCN